ncbi:MFS transporter [bacterium]|nr:MFS transporter [bacterium]
MRRIFPALAHTAFALVWSGALLSNVGGWIENVCQGWLVYDKSGSTVWSGFFQAASGMPMLLLAIPMGIVADRVDRRRLLLATQIALAAFAALQAVAAHVGWTSPGTTVVIALIEGVAAGAMIPAFQAFLPELVPREDLGSAIALQSIQFNVARLVGPMIAAVVIAQWGIAVAFDLNVASFLLVILALAVVRSRPATVRRDAPWRSELREGFRHAWSHRGIVRLIWCGAMFLFLAAPVFALLPAISVELMGGRVGTFSTLLSAIGLGAVFGGLLMGRVVTALPRHRAIALACSFTGLALVVLSLSRSWALSHGILFAFGVGWCVTLTSQNTALQLLVPDKMRGRIMSLSFTAMMCLAPVGQLMGGVAAARATLPVALAGLGLGTTVLGLFQLAFPESAITASEAPVVAVLPVLAVEKADKGESVQAPS